MPAKNTTKTKTTKPAKKNRAATAAQSGTPTPEAETVRTDQGGDGGPRTEAEGRLWAVLSGKRQTTAALAVAAGVGRSTAAKALARWALAGTITRDVVGEGVGSRSEWSRPQDLEPEVAPEQDEAPSQAALAVVPEQATDEETGAEPDSGQDEAPAEEVRERLSPGALHGLVEDFLREHPGEEFGPSQIGKKLDRSSGAVNNALEIMTSKGVVMKTCAAPKRFMLADSGD